MSKFEESVNTHIELREAIEQQLCGEISESITKKEECVLVKVKIEDGIRSWSTYASPENPIWFTVTLSAMLSETAQIVVLEAKFSFSKDDDWNIFADDITITSLNNRLRTFVIKTHSGEENPYSSEVKALAASLVIIDDMIKSKDVAAGSDYPGVVGSAQRMAMLLFDSITSSIVDVQNEEREESIGKQLMEETDAESAVTQLKQGNSITFKGHMRINKSNYRGVKGKYAVTKCTKKSIILKGIDESVYQQDKIIKLPMVTFQKMILNRPEEITIDSSPDACAVKRIEPNAEENITTQSTAANEG